MPKAPSGYASYQSNKLDKKINAVAKKAIKQHEKKVVELKYHEQVDSMTAISYSGTVTCLSTIARGDADTQRDGDRLSPLYMDLAYWINGEVYSGIIRMIIFRWLPATVPTATDIITAVGTDRACTQFYEHDQRSQYNVLYDNTVTVSNNGGSELKVVRKHIKLGRKQIDYTAGGTTGSNQFYVLYLSDRSLATSPSGFLRARLSYTDQ